MFATSVRVRPCSERSSPRSVGRVTVTTPSASSIFIRVGTCCCSEPSGPATATRAGSIVTVTPSGIVMGAFPILLMLDDCDYQMKATTSPPIPCSCAVRLVTRPDDVDRIATPIPPSTRGRRSFRA